MALKKSLSEQDGTDTARDQYRHILAKEMRGPGDMQSAMYRLQSKYGLDYWRQWGFKYRGAALPAFLEQVRQAYLDTLASSVRRDLEALKTEQSKEESRTRDVGLGNLVTEAEALLAKIHKKRRRVSSG